MEGILLPLIYLVTCLVVALCAIGRRPGFLVTLLLSIILTPFIMLLILYVTQPRTQAG